MTINSHALNTFLMQWNLLLNLMQSDKILIVNVFSNENNGGSSSLFYCNNKQPYNNNKKGFMFNSKYTRMHFMLI